MSESEFERGVRAERERVVGLVDNAYLAMGELSSFARTYAEGVIEGLQEAINGPELPPRARSESGQSGGGLQTISVPVLPIDHEVESVVDGYMVKNRRELQECKRCHGDGYAQCMCPTPADALNALQVNEELRELVAKKSETLRLVREAWDEHQALIHCQRGDVTREKLWQFTKTCDRILNPRPEPDAGHSRHDGAPLGAPVEECPPAPGACCHMDALGYPCFCSKAKRALRFVNGVCVAPAPGVKLGGVPLDELLGSEPEPPLRQPCSECWGQAVVEGAICLVCRGEGTR